MNILQVCGEQLLTRYLNPKYDFAIICDNEYLLMALEMQKVAEVKRLDSQIMVITSSEEAHDHFQKCVKMDKECIVLLSESSFVNFKLRQYLDLLSEGIPLVHGLNKKSYVSILPLESAVRVYSSDYSQDKKAIDAILSKLCDDRIHQIKTAAGTDITFTSRKWGILGNEIYTAPMETSINGIIAVDGALFFKKLSTTLYVEVSNGKFTSMYAESEQAKLSIDEYTHMTKTQFAFEENKQLAEVGIGINTNAIISDCFMESEMMFGTCHFCFGNNACYGGANKTNFHGASVLIKNPHFIVL